MGTVYGCPGMGTAEWHNTVLHHLAIGLTNRRYYEVYIDIYMWPG